MRVTILHAVYPVLHVIMQQRGIQHVVCNHCDVLIRRSQYFFAINFVAQHGISILLKVLPHVYFEDANERGLVHEGCTY